MDIFDIFKALNPQDKQAFINTIAYCETRVTADDGIPAIIALDDLTDTGRSFYQPAKQDEQTGALLAAAALLYTNLYETEKEQNPHYPAIALAMSAVAEHCFRCKLAPDESISLVPYKDVVGQFLK